MGEPFVICINCKKVFEHVPHYQPNECNGIADHTFVKIEDIMSPRLREAYAKSYDIAQQLSNKGESKHE